LGFLVDYLFRRTGIADAIVLLIFGLFLSSLKVIDPQMLMPFVPVFSQIALLIILMDGGMEINLYEALKGSFRATLLATVGFLFAAGSAALVTIYLFNWDLVYGLLFGTIVGNPTPFSYLLSLAIAFILFSLVESVGGSGPVSALLFGLALGNEENIAYILKHEKEVLHFNATLKAFHAEISFFIRAFFFVLLGAIILIPTSSIILYGVLISLTLFAARIISVKACTVRSYLQEDEAIIRWMVPRGLAPAVLSLLVLSAAHQYPEKIMNQNATLISELVFVMIIMTILICTVGTYLYSRIHSPSPSDNLL